MKTTIIHEIASCQVKGKIEQLLDEVNYIFSGNIMVNIQET